MFCVMLISLTLCSCKEHEALFKEKADLEVSLQEMKNELAALETQINTVGDTLYNSGVLLERQIKAADDASQKLTQEVRELSGKSDRLDAALKQFRPKVEAYKAKNLR